MTADVLTLAGTKVPARNYRDTPTPAQREAFLETLQHNAQNPRHAPTVMLHAKHRGTEVLYFSMNPAARHFANIAGRPDKSLTAAQVREIEGLGFNVELVGARS